jgi:hypothetical protein
MDSDFVRQYGFSHLVASKHPDSDWGPFNLIGKHLARRYLRQYKARGVPITMADTPWTEAEIRGVLNRGPHKSAYEFNDFLRDDMADYIEKGFWVVLPYHLVKDLPKSTA